MQNRLLGLVVAVSTVALLSVATTAGAGTLEDVKKRGVLRCVVSTGVAGFAYPDKSGVWKGFDIDFCRATAAAVLGDSKKIRRSPRPVKLASPNSTRMKASFYGGTLPLLSRVMLV